MSLSFTASSFPENSRVKNASGLPWGVVIQPFAQSGRLNETSKPCAVATDVARCRSCFAYVNPFVSFVQTDGDDDDEGVSSHQATATAETSDTWICSLCGTRNTLEGERYSTPSSRTLLPELTESAVEFEVATSGDGGDGAGTLPVYVAVIDVSACHGGDTYIGVVKSAILAALEVVPSQSLFGLITYSDRIGVFDLRSKETPHVKHINIPAAGNECAIGIEEVMGLTSFLVPVSECLLQIHAAMDILPELIRTAVPRRGLGPTMSSLFDFLDLYDSMYARVLVFISGAPNYGLGALEKSSELTPQTDFYLEQAERAAQSGVCVDLSVISNSFAGLASIKFLSLLTGGNLLMYDNDHDATLPQDVYRMYSLRRAYHSALRVRTSSEYAVNNAFGHLYPDPNYDGLFHIPGCDSWKTVGFDFEFTTPIGFARNKTRAPVLQLAFAYTSFERRYADGGVGGGGGDDGVDEGTLVLVKRLRVVTAKMEVAPTPDILYRDGDPNVMITLLTHKISQVVMTEGILTARSLLEGWLVYLMIQYNQQVVGTSNRQNIDVSFSQFANLRVLPRLVYALLQGPLLTSESVHPDNWSFLQCLFTCLEPVFLRKAIYPQLSSFGAPNNLATTDLSLSRSSIASSGARLFLMDGFTLICVYYAETAGDSIPFPPPKDSLIRTMADELKRNRPITPQLITARHGTKECEYFDAFLVEEMSRTGQSYTQFLEHCSREVGKGAFGDGSEKKTKEAYAELFA
eukprot:TRINITY_DN230_c0_g3_i1.p1 TRINITY_DN230_c0_g3~~TRINITY_DN230_c0_g3_i1.p1  ORF type:complete len:746 (+),score=141.18 TRINITY_DN230_c0_g3_i1:85-2322(+)